MTNDFSDEKRRLQLLYRDDALAVVFKPSGLLVHRSELAAGENESAMTLLRDQLGTWVYPVHRLDRQASGALLFALSSEMASRLAELFRNHAVDKSYLALVRGWPPQEGGIDRAIQNREGGPRLPARTRYRGVSRFELPYPSDRYPTSRVALVRLWTETGRLHQVRRHLHSISHPILGDTVHGDGKSNRLLRERLGAHRLMLLGESLSLIHPGSGERLRVEAPLDADFERVLRELQPFRNESESGKPGS